MKQSGFAVDRCADGEEALIFARSTPFDVSVVDVMLPQLDGLSLIQQMRKEGIRTPVIILSAKASVDDRVRGLQAGRTEGSGAGDGHSKLDAFALGNHHTPGRKGNNRR